MRDVQAFRIGSARHVHRVAETANVSKLFVLSRFRTANRFPLRLETLRPAMIAYHRLWHPPDTRHGRGRFTRPYPFSRYLAGR
jgi:hypothetical protein